MSEGNLDNFTAYIKCRDDVTYFFENYLRIPHPARPVGISASYPHMYPVFEHWKDNPYSIVLHARQTGYTTALAGFLLWRALFHSERAVVLQPDITMARSFMEIVRNQFEFLPDWMKSPMTQNNKDSMAFGRGFIRSMAATEKSTRGLSVNWLVFTEVCKIPDHKLRAYYESNVVSVAHNAGHIIYDTGGYSPDTEFTRHWSEATRGVSHFAPYHVQWNMLPGRDEQFKEYMIAQLGSDRWEREFEHELI